MYVGEGYGVDMSVGTGEGVAVNVGVAIGVGLLPTALGAVGTAIGVAVRLSYARSSFLK